MPPLPNVPGDLARETFTIAGARSAGLTKEQLRSRSWMRVGPGIYAHGSRAESIAAKLDAARLRVPDGAPFSGLTAAWLHGLDVQPCDPVEVTVPKGWGISARAGLKLKRDILDPGDVTEIDGWPVTAPVRTVSELGRRPPLTEAVALVDVALRKQLVTLGELAHWVAKHPGYRGARVLRRAIALADPRSESPMESRLRVILADGRLPAPIPQAEILDADGSFIARVDLYFPGARLIVEYDGGVHRDQLAEDNRRQNRLINAGYRLLRFTNADVYATPSAVRRQVMSALHDHPTRVPALRSINGGLIEPGAGTRGG